MSNQPPDHFPCGCAPVPLPFVHLIRLLGGPLHDKVLDVTKVMPEAPRRYLLCWNGAPTEGPPQLVYEAMVRFEGGDWYGFADEEGRPLYRYKGAGPWIIGPDGNPRPKQRAQEPPDENDPK